LEPEIILIATLLDEERGEGIEVRTLKPSSKRQSHIAIDSGLVEGKPISRILIIYSAA
jgi:hypothetical protein